MHRAWAKVETVAEVHLGRSWSSLKLQGTASALDFFRSPRLVTSVFWSFHFHLMRIWRKKVVRIIWKYFLSGEYERVFLSGEYWNILFSGISQRGAASEHIQPFLCSCWQNQPAKCLQQVRKCLCSIQSGPRVAKLASSSTFYTIKSLTR